MLPPRLAIGILFIGLKASPSHLQTEQLASRRRLARLCGQLQISLEDIDFRGIFLGQYNGAVDRLDP